MAKTWDEDVDVLVVGTGAAALTAAITAADSGLKTLVIESTERWGGTTNLSGGGLWMPTNPLMARHGIPDTVEEALAYMDATIGDAGPATSPERKRAFVETAPEVVLYLERLGVRWAIAAQYPDYYPDRVGGKVGRSIEAAPFDTRALGDWWKKSRVDEALPLPVKTDDVWLLARAWSTRDGFVRGARVVGRVAGSIVRGQRAVGMGSALVANLMTIVLRQGTRVLLETPLTGLEVEGGRVVGGVATRTDGSTLRIRARDAVVLGAGGFARNAEWREKYQGVPAEWSSAPAGDQGSVIAIAEGIGAQLDLMDDAWWGPTVPAAPGGRNTFIVSDRSMPFSIIVDQTGQRYANESESYVDFGHAMLERDKISPTVPSWMILDARNRRRYLATALLQPKPLREAGIVMKADTIEALAVAIGVDPSALRATVERFNSFARNGVDEDFGRGRTAYDRYYGDPSVKPNPNLGTLEKGPFTAVKVVPGDLGTKGGVVTDEHARVLAVDGAVIEGLYAAGNTTASVMGRTYPGPGSTIGPATVFGYRAGRHAAVRHATAAGRT